MKKLVAVVILCIVGVLFIMQLFPEVELFLHRLLGWY